MAVTSPSCHWRWELFIARQLRFQSFLRQPVGLTCLFFLLLSSIHSPLQAREVGPSDEINSGQEAEKKGNWIEACRSFYDSYRRDRSHPEYRLAYQRCLRRINIQQRHKDTSYHQILGRLKPSEANEIYKEVLGLLGTHYVDPVRTNLTGLFQEGLQELSLALDDVNFRSAFLANLSSDLIAAFKVRLLNWKTQRIQVGADAADEVASIIRVAQEMGLGRRTLLASVITMEFAFGACNALDEYSFLLTPAFPIDPAVLRSKQASTGIEIAFVEGRLEVTRVYPHSPAEAVGLGPHDRILKIDGHPVNGDPIPVQLDRLRGESGSLVEMEIQQPGMVESQLVRVERRPLIPPTVDFRLLPDSMNPELIGYMKIVSFQENTLQEVKDALAELQTAGIKALILDLRGNPGGLFRSAIAICELFVESGIVVSGRSSIKGYQGPIKVESNNPFSLPMMVLIDKGTASSSEVLAGALKERPLTRLMGQVTYGKGSIQSFLPLVKSTSGIRITTGIRLTVAHLFSPVRDEPYTGRGITPQDLIEAEGDLLLEPAKASLLQTIRGTMMIR